MFTKDFLYGVKQKALRRGVWFRALDSVERGILSLAARVVDRVESVVLGVELVKIIKKIRDAVKSGFVRRMEEFGYRRAEEIFGVAVEWGHRAASNWASDIGFVRYLTLLDMNQSTGFGV